MKPTKFLQSLIFKDSHLENTYQINLKKLRNVNLEWKKYDRLILSWQQKKMKSLNKKKKISNKKKLRLEIILLSLKTKLISQISLMMM